ncbi:MAG: hypothetical protein U5L06_04530 [Rhodovibrio sp.]|nr:hypothetical protein [Rhodovibrio sp.]
MAAQDIRVADGRLALQVAPRVVETAPFSEPGAAEVGLASMLRARTPTPGPDVAIEVGHYGAARAGDQMTEIDQRIGLHGRLTNLLTLPKRRVAADVTGGYSVGDLAAFDSGTLETTFTLRASPVARLSTETEIGWRGKRPQGTRGWTHGGHGRLGLDYAVPGFGTIGGFERLAVSGPRGHSRSYETGVELDFGPHTFSLSQRLQTIGGALAEPPATAAAYGWQVGPLAMALSADYTAESQSAPATGFAGLAVTLGLAGPGPGALLDALR